ncbi:hypothetical protein Mapa_017419 [Marchantia paleacea]|nr:hypothetical protein Mapa_017419 [Marchantia paleacea]
MRKSVTAMSTARRLGFDLNQEKVLQEVGYKSSAGSIMQALLLSSISDDDIQSFRKALGLNPLHIAAWTGNVKSIQDQLANGLNLPADASAQTEGGFTPLHLAASRGHADVIEFLLSVQGVDGKAVSQEGFIALHFAASVGHYESVKLLLQKCADAVNSKDYIFGRTALHFAALGGHATVAELVASRPADVTSQTAGGFTPLHLASSRGHADVVKFLLSLQGVDGNAISSEGFTALQLAAYGGHYESVRLLLERCADVVNSVDKVFGRTALHFAALGGGYTRDNDKFDRHAYAAVVELLATVPGFTISPKDRVRDLSPLLLAAMQPKHWFNLPVIEKLLQLDANHTHINEKVGYLEVSMMIQL